MTTKIMMYYNSDKGCWEIAIDNETYFVHVPKSWENTALALASCVHAGFDIEECFTCCVYNYISHTIFYVE